MARKISSRLKISGTLQAETPLHVGGYGVDVDTDLPLSRNGKNQLYIPGTSITGVLRAWCESNFHKAAIKEIFGFQETDKTKVGTNQDRSHASFVFIEDAVVTLPSGLQIEIRDGVGIDRFYGTAADKSKFDRAILPKGSKLKFEITVEIEDRKLKPRNKRKHNKDYEETEDQFKKRISETKAIFGHLLEALQKSEIRFGASKTRGLGRVKFELTEIRDEKFLGFEENESILDLFDENKKLTISIQTLIAFDTNKTPKPPKPKLEITICWKPTLPLMNKAGYEGIGVDMLPVTSGVADDKLSLVLAGSSIKGAFRSHAERIVRTLLHCDDKTISDYEERNKKIETKGKNFNDQIDSIPFVEEVFGARKKTDSTNPKLGLGALSIDDCYSVERFDQKEWRNIEQGTAKDDDSAINWEISKAIETVQTKMTHQTKIQNPHFHITHHTAIDRFTGGVADGALYSVLAPHNIEWQPIKMSLDFGRTNGKDKCCLMLLLLVLRDLAENRLPLGFATNRGMGEVKVKNIKLKGKILDDYGLQKNEKGEVVLNDGKVSELDENFRNDLAKEWKECLKIN